MVIKLSNRDVSTAIKSLDIYGRIFIGQYDHINWEIRLNAPFNKDEWRQFEEKEHEREAILVAIKKLVLPNQAALGFYGSNGIWNEENDPRAIDAYDLQQTIRYSDAWKRFPEGGVTRNFDEPWIRGRYPKVSIEIVGDAKKYEMTIELLPEQYEIMVEAAKVYQYLYKGKFKKMFSLYTDNPKALSLAKDMENLSVFPHPQMRNHVDGYLRRLKAQKNN